MNQTHPKVVAAIIRIMNGQRKNNPPLLFKKLAFSKLKLNFKITFTWESNRLHE